MDNEQPNVDDPMSERPARGDAAVNVPASDAPGQSNGGSDAPGTGDSPDPGNNGGTRALFLLLIAVVLVFILVWLVLRVSSQQQALQAVTPEYFARDQVIVTGPADIIDAVIEQINRDEELNSVLLLIDADDSRPPDSENEQSVDGGNLGSPVTQAKLAAQATPTASPLASREIRLYRIVAEDPTVDHADVPEVVRRIRELGRPEVASDPNYVIGRTPVDPGSLGRTEGSPESSEGAALTNPKGAGEGEVDYFNQWAFYSPSTHPSGGVGIELFTAPIQSGTSRPGGTVAARGEDINVAIFDTSPYDIQGVPINPGEDPLPEELFLFEVAGVPDARDHGLFVASLVHAVAPDSKIMLYRVLNESAQGDLVTLLRALDHLFEVRRVDPKTLVINLSLSVHPDPAKSMPTTLDGQVVMVESLYHTLRDIYNSGTVIIAAAGNNSAQRFRDGLRAEGALEPAAYDFVLGVGASNHEGEAACYSNLGDVYAPGGDNDRTTCEPIVDQCPAGSPSDNHCVIGYSVYTSPEENYAYWVGSSFAAPLVSGQAALILSSTKDSSTRPGVDQVIQTIRSTAEVAATVTTASRPPVPIVNIAGSLP